MIYLCLDTNIYMQQLTDINGKEDSEENYISPHIISVLSILLEQQYVTLILPEVIILELEKANRSFQDDYKDNYSKLKNKINEFIKEIWSEARDICEKLCLFIDEEQDNKIKYWIKTYEIIQGFFRNEKIIKLNLDPGLVLQNEKKRISGEINTRNTNDELIKMQLENFTQAHLNDEDEFIFITNNKKDFFIDNSESNGKFKLSWDERENYYGYFSLKSFLKKFNNEYDLEIDDSEIADEGVNLANLEIDFDDFESEEGQTWLNEQAKYHEIWRTKYKEKFDEKLNESPQNFREIRNALLLEINNLLSECRKTKSWDHRSEYKLSWWLEDKSEQELYFSTLSELIVISNNLKEYLRIHLEMDKNNGSIK